MESIAYQAAVRAARLTGPLTAGPALATLFQVNSSWRRVSHSEILWRNLTRSIWGKPELLHSAHESWQDFYKRLHRTAWNFMHGRAEHSLLDYVEEQSSSDSNNGSSTSAHCRRLALSSVALAAGYSDGSVRVFEIETRACVCTFRPRHEQRIGEHSRAVAGVAIVAAGGEDMATVMREQRVVFASMDGSVFVGEVEGAGRWRRAFEGDYTSDGVLVDFAASAGWWAGLYAGVTGRALRVWDALREDPVFHGGDFTDPDALAGWRLLVGDDDDQPSSPQPQHIGRLRIMEPHNLLVVATRSRLLILDLETQGSITRLQYTFNGASVVCSSLDIIASPSSVSAHHYPGRILLVSGPSHGSSFTARLLQHTAPSNHIQELASFRINPPLNLTLGGSLFAAINSLHAVFCSDSGIVTVWVAASGLFLYELPDRLFQDVNDLVASDSCVAACASDEGIHLWDFST